MALEPRLLLDGIVFPECPRWRDDRLWFSDVFGFKVMTVDLDGRAETVAEVDERPTGLGFLPDGTPLVVFSIPERLMRIDDGVVSVHADLKGVATGFCNDMVVDPGGRAYVGCGAIEGDGGPNGIVAIEADGSARLVATDIPRPNGMVLTPELDRLIFACPVEHTLRSLEVSPDGSLSNLQLFAELPGHPDGICLDAEGAVWFGSPANNAFYRVREGGEITDTISYGERKAVVPMLGGPGRRTLFLAGASWDEDITAASGFIDTVEVGVPGVGWP